MSAVPMTTNGSGRSNNSGASTIYSMALRKKDATLDSGTEWCVVVIGSCSSPALLECKESRFKDRTISCQRPQPLIQHYQNLHIRLRVHLLLPRQWTPGPVRGLHRFI